MGDAEAVLEGPRNDLRVDAAGPEVRRHRGGALLLYRFGDIRPLRSLVTADINRGLRVGNRVLCDRTDPFSGVIESTLDTENAQAVPSGPPVSIAVPAPSFSILTPHGKERSAVFIRKAERMLFQPRDPHRRSSRHNQRRFTVGPVPNTRWQQFDTAGLTAHQQHRIFPGSVMPAADTSVNGTRQEIGRNMPGSKLNPASKGDSPCTSCVKTGKA